MSFDAIIIGAGAAGLMAAGVAGQRGKRVLVIDHADEPGKKILISGGGRCNFTNVGTEAGRYLSKNPHFMKSALQRFTPADFIAMVDAAGIAWHEKTLGQLFCDGSARQIVDMLMQACPPDVSFLFGYPASAISFADGQFRVTVNGSDYIAPNLVIACGGPSIPKMGATGLAYDLGRQFGLKIVEPRPALVPLTLGGDELLFRDLSGVAAMTQVRCGKTRFQEASLFTHRGLSGPAILQISSYWRHGQPIGIDFLPGEDAAALLIAAKQARPRAMPTTILGEVLPHRLATALGAQLAFPHELGNMSDKALRAAGARLNDWIFHPNGTEGFAKAEVTLGGIDTSGLSSQTMAARHLPGLYCIGEGVDVTGWLGGYNFQWAWASGKACGESL